MSVIFEKRFYCYPLSHLGTDINRLFKFPLIPVLIVSSSLAIAAFIYISLVVWGRFQRKRTDSIDSTSSVISFCVYNNSICKKEILQYIHYFFSCVSLSFPLKQFCSKMMLSTFNNYRFNRTYFRFWFLLVPYCIPLSDVMVIFHFVLG